MSSSPPTTLGKYQIIREIARSNDIVYEAYDPGMNRRVAVKELAVPTGASSTQRDDRIRRFQREVKAAGSLSHPNIVTIYEVAEEGGRHYMAMEYLDGHTLRNEIDTKGFLDADRAVEIAVDVLCALQYAHEHGVIHRDIKPDNIQILENGTVKLTDFGIARLTFEPNLTMDGQVFGTPSYMSPEQVVGKSIDARSDLFSVGVVLYEMLTGQKPFSGDSVVTITYAILNSPAPTNPQIPGPLAAILQQAMDKTSAMRFASAKDMAEALLQARKTGQVPSAPSQGVVPPPIDPYASYNNPYAAPAPPAYNQQPYGQPYMAPPQQYGQPNYSQPYVPTPYAPPTYAQIPVYYPPPPRGPLISPEARAVWGRILLTILIVGTFLAVSYFGMVAAAKAYAESMSRKNDAPVQSQIQRDTAGQPLDSRIQTREQEIPTLNSQEAKADEAANLANDYAAKAREAESAGNAVEAEDYYKRARDADPNRASRYGDYAEFLLRNSQKYTDQNQRADALRQAAGAEERAAGLANTAREQAAYAERAARSYMALGTVLLSTNPNGAREAFYKARAVAPPDTQVYQEAQTWIEQNR